MNVYEVLISTYAVYQKYFFIAENLGDLNSEMLKTEKKPTNSFFVRDIHSIEKIGKLENIQSIEELGNLTHTKFSNA